MGRNVEKSGRLVSQFDKCVAMEPVRLRLSRVGAPRVALTPPTLRSRQPTRRKTPSRFAMAEFCLHRAAYRATGLPTDSCGARRDPCQPHRTRFGNSDPGRPCRACDGLNPRRLETKLASGAHQCGLLVSNVRLGIHVRLVKRSRLFSTEV